MKKITLLISMFVLFSLCHVQHTNREKRDIYEKMIDYAIAEVAIYSVDSLSNKEGLKEEEKESYSDVISTIKQNNQIENVLSYNAKLYTTNNLDSLNTRIFSPINQTKKLYDDSKSLEENREYILQNILMQNMSHMEIHNFLISTREYLKKHYESKQQKPNTDSSSSRTINENEGGTNFPWNFDWSYKLPLLNFLLNIVSGILLLVLFGLSLKGFFSNRTNKRKESQEEQQKLDKLKKDFLDAQQKIKKISPELFNESENNVKDLTLEILLKEFIRLAISFVNQHSEYNTLINTNEEKITKLQSEITNLNKKLQNLQSIPMDIDKKISDKLENLQQHPTTLTNSENDSIQKEITLYFATPDKDGFFVEENASTHFEDSITAYEVKIDKNDPSKATVSFVGDRYSTDAALDSRERDIKPICEEQNAKDNHKNITTIDPGILVKQGNKWLVKKKALILYT